jgi:peptide chain release factor 3
MDEGVAQMFTRQTDGRRIIGTVGQLQFEVIQHRLESEYNSKCRYEPVSLFKACWITSEDPKAIAEFLDRRKRDVAKDKDGNWVFLAETAWTLQTVQENFPKIAFHFTSEKI